MDFTDSGASKIIKDHILLPQTQNTMEVSTTYLLGGRLGSKPGNHKAILLQVIHTHVQSMLRSTTKSKPQDGRKQSIDKSGPQENMNMDGKSQETIHMHHKLIYNGNNKWIEAIDLEIQEIKEYQVFTDVGNAYLQALTREKLYIVGGLNLKNYMDMFLSCTKHFMVQDQEKHVGMINSLTYSITWVSRPQKLIGWSFP